MTIKKITNIDFKNNYSGKKVILRVDLNLPMNSGFVSDKTRLINIIPTIKFLQDLDCKIVLISHFGRPDGKPNSKYSLTQIISTINDCLGFEVQFHGDITSPQAKEKCNKLKPKEVILLENLRFYEGEETNDQNFAKQIASLCDIYVNDAFGCCHRSHASIDAITNYLPSYCGLLLEKEIENAEMIIKSNKPMTCLVGGSKISTKIDLLKSLVSKARNVIVGGGMANTFYFAQGLSVGKSLHEPNFSQTAKDIIMAAKQNNCNLILPEDVFVTDDINNPKHCSIKHISKVQKHEYIVDIGFESLKGIEVAIKESKITVWNGPFGVFEKRPFNIGTESIARIISSLTSSGDIYSIVGGGDVVSALLQSGLENGVSYISTGGGSFLEYLEKGFLPGVKALEDLDLKS